MENKKPTQKKITKRDILEKIEEINALFTDKQKQEKIRTKY